jgi:uncharacterized protein (TIGR01777 family)
MQFEASTILPTTASEVFAWHERPGAFTRLTPPWKSVQVIEPVPSLRDGSRGKIRVKIGPVGMGWLVEHRGYNPPHQFEDLQLRGPFESWHHRHKFEQVDDDHCKMTDAIEFEPKGQPLTGAVMGGFLQNDLAAVFRYRHDVTLADLSFHKQWSPGRSLRIVLSGSSGLVGSQLGALLTTGGHEVIKLVRREKNLAEEEACWLPEQGIVGEESRAKLSGCDAVIHLAGASIADKRWTPERKKVLRDSRVAATEKLASSLLGLSAPPKAFVGASAIGYYGNRGDDQLDESSKPADNFLAELAADWEAAATGLAQAGIRVAHGRIGIVMTPAGGALAKLLPPARLGLGGPIGDGQQWYSPVSLDDTIYALAFLACRDDLTGPFNLVCPNPIRQRALARALGQVIGRPAFMPAPSFAMRLLVGEMAEELLLSSTRVLPSRLLEAGFTFQQPDCETIFRHVLGEQR